MSNYASPISKLISYKKHKKMLKYFPYIYTEILKNFTFFNYLLNKKR